MVLIPFLTSLLLGFLIGLEREKAAPNRALGLRTFTLLALLGAVAGWADFWIALILTTFALSLITLAYFRESAAQTKADRGLTTEIAAGIVFALSYSSHQHVALVALLGCLVALLLFWKTPLHRFSARLQPRELEAALVLLLIAIGVTGLLEDKTIDPWNLFNPKKFGVVILAIGILEFGSYLVVKWLGGKKSPAILGFFAGLASSTVALLTAGKAVKQNPQIWKNQLGMVLAAQISALMEFAFIIFTVSSPLLWATLPMILSSILIATVALVWCLRHVHEDGHSLEVRSPLDIWGILRLSLLFMAILAAISLAQKFGGNWGREITVFLTGLFELHGVSLATSTLYAQHQLDLPAALMNLRLALVASFCAKAVLAWIMTRTPFAWALTLIFCTMSAAALLTATLQI